MALFAYVNIDTDEIVKYVEYLERPADPQGKPYEWLPVEDTMPGYDAKTQVLEGPVVEVTTDAVTRVWSVRDKTPEELAGEVDQAVNTIDETQYAGLADLHARVSELEGVAVPVPYRQHLNEVLRAQRMPPKPAPAPKNKKPPPPPPKKPAPKRR